ncbi:cytochrome b [Endozoicomonadaceae bacterium StTr2]
MSAPHRYSLMMRAIHWLMAIAILGLIASGWFMAGLDKSVDYKYDIYPGHKSFGVLILFLLVLRIVIRLFSKIPPLPSTMPKIEKGLAHLGHTLLYLLMFLVPASGYLMSAAAPGREVAMFGWVLPNLVEKDKELASLLHDIHEVIPYVLLGVIAVHLLAVIKHRMFDHPDHDSLKRML